MKYLHMNTGKCHSQLEFKTASLRFNTLCMIQYFVIMRFIFHYYRRTYMFIMNMNLWILPTNIKCAIFCTQVLFPVIDKRLSLNNTTKDEGNAHK